MSRRAKRPILFKKVRRTVCPACLDRNAINLVGKPIWLRGQKLTGGCELCNGDGEVDEGVMVGDFYEDLWVLRELA